MGATEFRNAIEGYNVQDAFKELVMESKREYGDNNYNGTISTTTLGVKKLSFDKYTKTNEKKAIDFIEKKINDCEKGLAYYVDLGIVEYHLLTVKKKNISNEKPIYKLKFMVDVDEKYYLIGMGFNVKPKSFDTKTDADKYAMEQTLKTLIPHKVTKEYILEKGNSELTEVSIDKKSYKSKPKLKDMNNKKLLEVHKFIFYGKANY